ncbi:MAG: HEAT repeat domain-containing protein [Planctomycetes bacterium]|nr:HEAT repeat domain-containing protein [Planctomycetota bacterium]
MRSVPARCIAVLLAFGDASLVAQDDKAQLAALSAETFDAPAFAQLVEAGSRTALELVAIATEDTPTTDDGAARRRQRARRALRLIGPSCAGVAFAPLAQRAERAGVPDDEFFDLLGTIAAIAPGLDGERDTAARVQNLTMLGMRGRAGGEPKRDHLRCLLGGIRIHARCRHDDEPKNHDALVKQLLEKLFDQDPFAREFAAERLGLLGDRGASVLDALRGTISAVDHPRQAKFSGPGFSSSVGTDFSAMIQDAAAIALARLSPDDPLARRGLARLLEADDPRERVAAAMAIGPGAEADAFDVVPALIAATKDDDPLVAGEAVTALGRTGDARSEVLDRLRALAQQDGALGARSKSALRRIERGSEKR